MADVDLSPRRDSLALEGLAPPVVGSSVSRI